MGEYKSMVAAPTGWLGSIPEHWECKKIGSLFSERKTKVSDADYPPLSVTKLGIVPQLANAAKSDSGDNRKLVCLGDFVINSRSDRKGSCGVSELDGSVSLINIVLTPRNSWDNKYVHYLMRSQPFSEEYYHYGRGIVADLWTTRYSEMKNILLPVPPQDEQEQIVRFLDWKISGINKLINHYRNEISSLSEMKAKIIDDATTRGVKNSTLKHNYDIRWDIDYPESWDIKRMRECFTFRKGLSITKANLEETGLPVISYGQFHSKENTGVALNDELIRFVNSSYLETGKSALVERNDFIFADTSEDLTGCGNCAFIDSDDIIFAGYHSVIAHPTISGNTKYLAYLFQSPTWRYQIRKKVNAVKVYSITQKILKDVFILIPSENEQEEIVKYLDDKCSSIDLFINKINEKIDQLHDLKNTMIADVVTGKIDVRDIDIPKYEFTDESADSDSEGADFDVSEEQED